MGRSLGDRSPDSDRLTVEPTFRASMNWLHTWAGVVLGGVLFAIFWMGALSVFDREIDRWMKPATRLVSTEPRSIDAIAKELQPLIDGARQWYVVFPTERDPMMRVGYRKPPEPFVTRDADPSNSALLPDSGSWAGTGFIFPFHYRLHLRFANLGYWIVGVAGMAMMALCVTGVIIHRKIFTDFFTFRADRKPRRLVLDLHNVAGVLGLPFHFLITLSGLVIFFAIYFPSVRDLAYQGDRALFNKEIFGTFSRPKADRPAGPEVSIDRLIAEARTMWGGARPSFVRIWHPGDAQAYVEIRRTIEDSVTMNLDVVYFDAATGSVLQTSSTRPVMTAQRFISGLHFIQFRHWSLRWLYFGAGLLGCVLIATGYLFWLESRRKKHEQLGLKGVRIVDGLTIGSVTGIVAATLVFFIANRLLPLGATFLGQERAALEAWAFYLVWAAAFVHAWRRPHRAWSEQCWAIAALAVLAPLLNWISTGDHLLRSLTHRHLWAVGGMDLLLLAGAAVAALSAVRIASGAAGERSARAASPAMSRR